MKLIVYNEFFFSAKEISQFECLSEEESTAETDELLVQVKYSVLTKK
jgi:hypothetical protein